MRYLLAIVVVGSLILVACGGGGSSMPDVSSVPTATAPAQLSAPIIIGEAQPVGEPDTYVVESGDSLFAIAEKLGVDPDELIALNELADPSNLEVGQVLLVPGTPPAPEEPAPLPGEPTPLAGEPTPVEEEEPPPPVATGEYTYTVESGDNASTIADGCGFTLDELAAANGTTIDGLRSLEVGQVLALPGPCVAPEPAPEEPPPETVEPPPEATEPPPETVEPPPEATEPPPEIVEPTPEVPELPPETVEPPPEAPTAEPGQTP